MTDKELKLLEISILEKLHNELPENLYYHSAAHTKRVVEKAEIIAAYENVSGRDFELVRIAALFHDIGFVRSITDHEVIGCEMVRSYFNGDQLKEEEIEKICGMIMATKIPQTPHNLLEEILADADLEYLGTEDFTRISNYLFREKKYSTPELTERKWMEFQIDFMEKHTYFTSFGKKYLSDIKKNHIQQLKDDLFKLSNSN